MQVSLTTRVTGARPFAAGESPEMPLGLARRGFDLPPGIARKIVTGTTLPPGIARRFPPPAPAQETSPPGSRSARPEGAVD